MDPIAREMRLRVATELLVASEITKNLLCNRVHLYREGCEIYRIYLHVFLERCLELKTHKI